VEAMGVQDFQAGGKQMVARIWLSHES
jgi:hypothetical protein